MVRDSQHRRFRVAVSPPVGGSPQWAPPFPILVWPLPPCTASAVPRRGREAGHIEAAVRQPALFDLTHQGGPVLAHGFQQLSRWGFRRVWAQLPLFGHGQADAVAGQVLA